MIHTAFQRGRRYALVHFKLAQPGIVGNTPAPSGTASASKPAPSMSAPGMTPPTSPAPPMAAGAAKANVLG